MNGFFQPRFRSLACAAAVAAVLATLGGCSSSGQLAASAGGQSSATPGGLGGGAKGDNGDNLGGMEIGRAHV